MAVKKITSNTIVECKNGVHGPLIYISSRTAGYTVEWEDFGDIQEIEYGELVAMRGSQPRFFRDNWILIEDAEVLKQLGVSQYYRNALTTENFDEVFYWSADKIHSDVPKMSEGMHDSIRMRAKELMKADGLDSRSVIKALNEVLHCDLEEELQLDTKKPVKKASVVVETIK